jgi:hypothetical protein
LHRIISDGEQLGLVPLPDNRPFGHMIYALTVENNVPIVGALAFPALLASSLDHRQNGGDTGWRFSEFFMLGSGRLKLFSSPIAHLAGQLPAKGNRRGAIPVARGPVRCAQLRFDASVPGQRRSNSPSPSSNRADFPPKSAPASKGASRSCRSASEAGPARTSPWPAAIRAPKTSSRGDDRRGARNLVRGRLAYPDGTFTRLGSRQLRLAHRLVTPISA